MWNEVNCRKKVSNNISQLHVQISIFLSILLLYYSNHGINRHRFCPILTPPTPHSGTKEVYGLLTLNRLQCIMILHKSCPLQSKLQREFWSVHRHIDGLCHPHDIFVIHIVIQPTRPGKSATLATGMPGCSQLDHLTHGLAVWVMRQWCDPERLI